MENELFWSAIEVIIESILFLRGQRVMLGADLARLYGVSTKKLKKQMRRNLPYVFPGQGVAIPSSVLKSKRIISMNIRMMRAFVRFREFRLTRKNLARKFEKLERKFKKYEDEIHMIFDAIRQLMKPPESLCRTIGFQT